MDKIKEVTEELLDDHVDDHVDEEIQRCIDWGEQNMNGEAYKVAAMECRIQTLEEVKNDWRK